jgi:hypothetical protein
MPAFDLSNCITYPPATIPDKASVINSAVNVPDMVPRDQPNSEEMGLVNTPIAFCMHPNR